MEFMTEEEGIEIYGYSTVEKPPHAAVRCKERYGIELTNEDLQKMSEICQGNSWARDYKKPLGYGKHHVHVLYKNIWFNIIYSSESKMVVTILHYKHDPHPKV